MQRKIYLTATAVLILTTAASADLIAIGDPVDGDSWSQAFAQKKADVGGSWFDAIAFKMVSTVNESTSGPSFDAFEHKVVTTKSGTTTHTASVTNIGAGWYLAGENVDPPPIVNNNVAQYTYPTKALIKGPTKDNVGFSLHFVGTKNTNPLVFDIATFSGQTLVGSERAVWNLVNGSWKWTFTSGSPGDYWSPTRAEIEAIPAPGAILLGLLGFSSTGWLKRRLA